MRTFGPIPSVRKRGREGVAAVEFALVGPILVLLLIGIDDGLRTAAAL